MRVLLGVGLLVSALGATAAKPELVNFPANARVVLDEQGVPQQVQANEKLPALVRHAIEQRIMQWRFEPARVNGVPKAGVTHVVLDACAVPQADGTLSVGMDYAHNGPAYADNRFHLMPPRYPIDAAKSGKEGTFRVVFQVHEDGSAAVQSIETKRGSLKPFEPTVREWIGALRFVPEEVDGKPVATLIATEVDFNMGNDIRPGTKRQEQEAAKRSPECMAAAGGGRQPDRTMVLDSPFKPLTTG